MLIMAANWTKNSNAQMNVANSTLTHQSLAVKFKLAEMRKMPQHSLPQIKSLYVKTLNSGNQQVKYLEEI